MKTPKIRIAQEIVGTTGNFVTGVWEITDFFVRKDSQDESTRVKVETPEQARILANAFSAETGGDIYRGSLPTLWQKALADIARS